MEPEISVVVPLFDEEANLEELHRRLGAILGGMAVAYELVLVNDGSRDSTANRLDALARVDDHVKPVHLSRNFGHQPAISAGLEVASGRAVVIMDGDLQDPPEILPEMVQLWRMGNDVVYAVRENRKENVLKRAAYSTFYRLLRLISDIDIPLDSGDFCLMDRRVAEAVRDLPERYRFIRGLRTFVGFRQIGLSYDRGARDAGRPKYSFRALVRLAIDGLVSFSSYPLRICTYLGLVNAVGAMGLTLWTLRDALLHQTAPRGWASLLVVILFMGSAQLISLGIIGEYLRLIFLETKRRPSYIIDRGRPPIPEESGGGADSGHSPGAEP